MHCAMVSRLAIILLVFLGLCGRTLAQPLDDIITANLTYGQYCSSLREVLLREQTGIVCELSDDCLRNVCTDALNPNVVISGYKLDPCAKQYTIIFAGETLVLRTDRDTEAGFGMLLVAIPLLVKARQTGGMLRISQWNAIPLAINNQFLNITIRTRSTYNGQTVESDDFSMLAPNRPCGLRGLTAAARAGASAVLLPSTRQLPTPHRPHRRPGHRVAVAAGPRSRHHYCTAAATLAAALWPNGVYGWQWHHRATIIVLGRVHRCLRPPPPCNHAQQQH